ncbi:MAG TPA: aldo/keto reductase [Bacteroides sp.]|nr:aldo/keto reductase [Bacteroides sp.]
MDKRKLGKSGLEVSPIALGAWAIGGWMWGGSDRKDSMNAIHACLDLGITSIDTAPVYGFGHSEKIVGEAVRGKRDRYEIFTKAGMRWEGTRGAYYFSLEDRDGNLRDIYKYSGKESIIRECEESLTRLGTDYIDLYQIHWPDPTTPIEEPMEAFRLLLEQGKIRAAGVSNYSVEELERATRVVELASNQVPYSMVRREIEHELVPWCIANQCGILAYSPLQRGLLTGKITPDYPFRPGDSRPETPHFRMNNLIKINQFLDAIKPLAKSRNATLSQLVIRWTLQQPGIDAVLVGARDRRQVKENAGAASLLLSEGELRFIEKELDTLHLDLS